MSTSFNALLANDAAIKASRIVEKAISKGVRGVDGLKVVENVGDNSLKVKILAGTYVYEPDLLIWSDTDLVVGGFTAATTERFDIVYLDVVCDTAIPAPDGGMVVKIAVDAASVPADEPGHRNIGLWRIHRSAGTSVLTQAEINAGQDLRIIPAEVAHTHNLAAGAVDVAASATEINQALDGITADVTAARLSELSGSDPTAEQLNELVGGDTTVLHSHNSTNSIETPAGTAIPVGGVLKVTQSGQAQVSAAGDTINIHVATDNLGNHTATQDLNMVTHAIKNVMMSTQDLLVDFPALPPEFDDPAAMEATNKRYVDSSIASAVGGYAKYNAEQDFDLNPTAAPIGKRIHNLEDGAVEKDAINKGQLDDAVASLGGSLANLDERYKLGLPGGPTDPNAPNYHLNNKAHGNIDLQDYKVQNSGNINKVTDLPKTLVTKQYVDDEIAEAVEDLSNLISGFFKNPAQTDLIMTGPYGAKNIVALQDPMTDDQAANKRYVDQKIDDVIAMIPTEPGAPTPGDNLGNHTATTNLNMNYKAVGRLVMPHQTGIIADLTEGDMLAVNRKYLFDALTGAISDIPQEELPDFSRFAKLGNDFETDKNVLPLNMAVAEGGEVNVRGTDGRGLLVIKPKPNAPGEDVFINSRIQGVEDPVEDNDAVNFKELKKRTTSTSGLSFRIGYEPGIFSGSVFSTLGNIGSASLLKFKPDTTMPELNRPVRTLQGSGYKLPVFSFSGEDYTPFTTSGIGTLADSGSIAPLLIEIKINDPSVVANKVFRLTSYVPIPEYDKLNFSANISMVSNTQYIIAGYNYSQASSTTGDVGANPKTGLTYFPNAMYPLSHNFVSTAHNASIPNGLFPRTKNISQHGAYFKFSNSGVALLMQTYVNILYVGTHNANTGTLYQRRFTGFLDVMIEEVTSQLAV